MSLGENVLPGVLWAGMLGPLRILRERQLSDFRSDRPPVPPAGPVDEAVHNPVGKL